MYKTRNPEKVALQIQIGKNVRKARMASGMTQKILANLVDISRENIGCVERGVTGLSIIKLIRVAEVTDCSFSALILSEDGAVLGEKSHNHPKRLHDLIDKIPRKNVEAFIQFHNKTAEFKIK